MMSPFSPRSLLIFSVLIFSPSSSVSIDLDFSPSLTYSQDYGKIIEESPVSVLRPTSPTDISLLLKSISTDPAQNSVAVAARGAAHSTYGQAQAPGGIVIDMTSLPNFIKVENGYVDAGGGALWVDVLEETLKYGLTPRTWTDYLYLTVGGTLSNAGVSGQAFRYGPQISNVIELDVVTGKGEQVTCSELVNSDLFYGVLGGLGQFGIITRARIILQPAPQMVKRVEIIYGDFDQFTKDQEFLISKGKVDYLEGFVNLKASTSTTIKELPNPYYTIEFALYYNDTNLVQNTLDHLVLQLGSVRLSTTEFDASFFEFLNRVKATVDELIQIGLWDIPHPWFNLFVPKAQIVRFKDLVIQSISNTYIGGPIIIYPILRHKWNLNMSVMLPEVYPKEDIVYIVSVLQWTTCERGSQCLETLLSQNKKVISIATSEPNTRPVSINNPTTSDLSNDGGGMGAKQYLPYWTSEEEWRAHFGAKWDRFKDLKTRFDPLNILAPGQRIFKRKPIVI